jgi:hypothetical protein
MPDFFFKAGCDKISNLRLVGDISKILESIDNYASGKYIPQLIKVELDISADDISFYYDKMSFCII